MCVCVHDVFRTMCIIACCCFFSIGDENVDNVDIQQTHNGQKEKSYLFALLYRFATKYFYFITRKMPTTFRMVVIGKDFRTATK